MPAFDIPPQTAAEAAESQTQFPPVTRDHILHCSYDYWFPKYRTSCIRSRVISLPPEFVEYIREDGIILADDDGNSQDGDAEDDDDWEPTAAATAPRPALEEEEHDSDEEEAAPRLPPNKRFPAVHQVIKDKIRELGGAVAPKLNWSSPKDATWISMHQNTLKCTTPNDIYLLLKSSSFVSHDLEHAFDGTTPAAPRSASSASQSTSEGALGFQPVLVLRSFFSPHTALEFRCFVKHRNLVAITQRDLNHYAFLQSLRPAIVARVKELFDTKLRFTFPEGNFAFDVYMPEAGVDEASDDDDDGASRLGRARLIDINPWAPRTDTLLFDWNELLELSVPQPLFGVPGSGDQKGAETEGDEVTTTEDEADEDDYVPELRLVEKDDPSAYNFSSPQYSAHKLPKEVVDASMGGQGGLKEFAEQWNRMMERR
ncbi:hypothetical protein NKR23_g2221 [Pleurostoma richardsiae]|uniref:Cell division cycle protein 123 n=1 Tax=Pleurostoma richardsiae TaxID=41990 RepID=A0AA38S223_9PEZI|nr:hypothetical protein NKR23_g2221 [Pleurostoma richardsiae]